jgi:hypothetical protein
MSGAQIKLPAKFAKVLEPEILSALREAMEEEFERREGELGVEAFRAGLVCGLGRTYADFVLDDLTGNAARSNAAFAEEHGLTRAAVSKMLNRCRRNLGFGPRVPNNARPGARPKGAATSASNSDLVKSTDS